MGKKKLLQRISRTAGGVSLIGKLGKAAKVAGTVAKIGTGVGAAVAVGGLAVGLGKKLFGKKKGGKSKKTALWYAREVEKMRWKKKYNKLRFGGFV